MGTNSSTLAALPQDGAGKSARHRLHAVIGFRVRGGVACSAKDPAAHRSSHHHFATLFSWWAASCAAAGAWQIYSDAHA